MAPFGIDVSLMEPAALAKNLSDIAQNLLGGTVAQWLEVRAAPAKLGHTIAFADARIEVDGAMIAKASASFRIFKADADAT